MLRIFFEVPAEQYVASFSPVQSKLYNSVVLKLTVDKDDHMLIGTLSGVEEVVSTGRSVIIFILVCWQPADD